MATIKILVVGGGGGGGGDNGAGGGAGGVQYNAAFAVSPEEYTVTIGQGGSAGVINTDSGSNGGNSTFSTITALGGGFGATGQAGLRTAGTGGCGGGGDGERPTNGAAGSQGGAGGNGAGGGAGGGGGTNGNGANGVSTLGGAGGIGTSTYSSLLSAVGVGENIGGTYYIGGGGGGGNENGVSSPLAAGGSGGGGDAGYGTGTAGTANTGGGGGGSSFNGVTATGGIGGSGIVIISYLTSDFGVCTGGIKSIVGSETIHTFLVSGTFTVVAPNPIKKINKVIKANIRRLSSYYNIGKELSSSSLLNDANLVGYWKFEGNSLDETANNHDGTDTDITYGITYGKFRQGASFNGSTSRIDIGSFGFNYNNITISAWIYPTSLAARETFISLTAENTGIVPTVEVGSGNTNPNSVSVIYPGVWLAETYSNVITTNTWFHIVYTKNGNGATNTIYINGIAQILRTNVSVTMDSTAKTKLIGSRTTATQFFPGYIDDVAIFSRALSATEVLRLYQSDIKKIGGVSNV